MKNKDLYYQIRTMQRLKSAWNHIYSNGVRLDKSPKTRGAVQEYKEKEFTHLKSLQSLLQRGKYKFPPAIASTPEKKKGKGNRPIVVTDVNTRILQRSILDILQEQSFLKPCLNQQTSFGGIPKEHRKSGEVGVEGAIKLLLDSIYNGAAYYIKSDIKAFFTDIPLPTVYSILEENISDKNFISFIKQSTNLEIANIKGIKPEFRDLFDFNIKGTPQGCCLSSLFGNILLQEFDQVTNSYGAVCIRFLDDFIIVAPDTKTAWLSFTKGINVLKKHGLTVYNPKTDKDKANEGPVSKSFDFLGVTIEGLDTAPSLQNRNNLLESIDKLIKKSIEYDLLNPENKNPYDHSFASTLVRISNKIEGWGNQYKFCSNRKIMKNIDKSINERIRKFLNSYEKKKRIYSESNISALLIRRLLGVHLLSDCKCVPYQPAPEKIDEKTTN